MDISEYLTQLNYEPVRTIMGVFAATFLLMEIVLNLNNVDNDTGNIILLEWSKGKMIFIPFALGAIGGHLFLGTTDPAFKFENVMYPVFLLAAICAAGAVLGHLLHFERSKLFLTATLLAGLLYGHLFWSMDYI